MINIYYHIVYGTSAPLWMSIISITIEMIILIWSINIGYKILKKDGFIN